MFTSHILQPSKPRGQPRVSHDSNKNLGHDWKRRYVPTRRKSVQECERLVPTNDDDAGTSPALSFVTAASETEAYTMSQESHATLNEGSNALGIFEESDSSIETIADTRVAAKQPNKRKRRSTNAGSEA
ncbi:hypothetical protein PSPO01_16003 [Paraphaeosphaeria sporulosa]